MKLYKIMIFIMIFLLIIAVPVAAEEKTIASSFLDWLLSFFTKGDVRDLEGGFTKEKEGVAWEGDIGKLTFEPQTKTNIEQRMNLTISSYSTNDEIFDIFFYGDYNDLEVRDVYEYISYNKTNERKSFCSSLNYTLERGVFTCYEEGKEEVTNKNGTKEKAIKGKEWSKEYVDYSVEDNGVFVYWNEEQEEVWKPEAVDIIKEENKGYTLYIIKGIEVEGEGSKTLSIDLFSLPSVNNKFNVGIKYSSDSYSASIRKKDYVLLDPFDNSTYDYRKCDVVTLQNSSLNVGDYIVYNREITGVDFSTGNASQEVAVVVDDTNEIDRFIESYTSTSFKVSYVAKDLHNGSIICYYYNNANANISQTTDLVYTEGKNDLNYTFDNGYGNSISVNLLNLHQNQTQTQRNYFSTELSIDSNNLIDGGTEKYFWGYGMLNNTDYGGLNPIVQSNASYRNQVYSKQNWTIMDNGYVPQWIMEVTMFENTPIIYVSFKDIAHNKTLLEQGTFTGNAFNETGAGIKFANGSISRAFSNLDSCNPTLSSCRSDWQYMNFTVGEIGLIDGGTGVYQNQTGRAFGSANGVQGFTFSSAFNPLPSNRSTYYLLSQNWSYVNESYYTEFWENQRNGNVILTLGAEEKLIPVLIDYPTNTTYSSLITSLNYTINQSFNLDKCWNQMTNLKNTNLNSSTISPGTNFTNIRSAYGTNTLNLYCNSTTGAEYTDGVNYTISYNLTYEQNQTSSYLGEGDTNIYSLYVYLNDIEGLWKDTNATLSFNGTNYTVGKNIGTGFIKFSTPIEIPLGYGTSNSQNTSWFWNVWVRNGTAILNQSQLQPQNTSIYSFSMDNCVENNYVISNFTLYDEETLSTALNNSTIEVTAIAYSLLNSSYNYTTTITNGNITGLNNVSLCISTGAVNQTTYRLDTIARYFASDHVIEFYHNDNRTLNSNTTTLNVPFYDLLSTDSTSFIVNYKDSNYLPVEDSVIELYRYYVGEDVWRLVEWDKSDEDGNSLLHFETEDIIYRIVLRLNNQLEFTSSNFQAFCQALPCTIYFQQGGTLDTIPDFTTVDNMNYNITFNSDTRTVTLIYNSLDGTNLNVGLNVTQWDAYANTTVCADTLSASSGTITCTIGSQYKNVTYITDVYVGNGLAIQRFYSITPDTIAMLGNLGIMFTLITFLMFSLIGMALGSSIGIVLFGLLGIIFAAMLNFLAVGSLIGVGSTVLWLIIAGGIIIFKLSERRGG